MKTAIVEVTNGEQNWGKFMIGQFDEHELQRRSVIYDGPGSRMPLTRLRGWTSHALLVLDIETGEGAVFAPHGSASADLNQKHRIWVCPLFEPFLNWLYAQAKAAPGSVLNLDTLPPHVDLPDAPFDMQGYRREGGL